MLPQFSQAFERVLLTEKGQWELSTVGHVCHSSIWAAKAGGLQFKAHLGYNCRILFKEKGGKLQKQTNKQKSPTKQKPLSCGAGNGIHDLTR